MNKRHIIVGIGASVSVLLIIAVFMVYSVLTGSLPTEEGTLRVDALASTVNVYRDPAGIPHILAENEYDAYFAAGFVHAQDRLWQMDILRRYGSGRLAELLGPEALPIDRLMRTIGIDHIADSLLLHVSEQTRNILHAYSAGVNAGIFNSKKRLPVEFDLLQYEPEAWTPQHSLIVSRLMGWELALSWWVDLTLAELINRFGEEKALRIFPTDASDTPIIHTGIRYNVRNAFPMLRDALLGAQRLFASPGSSIGSNAWVVSGELSASGLPLLANDPHLLYMQPARWYVMHLSAPGLNVGGVSIPGAPAIVIGHNNHIAWGMTNVMADDVDFFFEDVNYRDSTYLDDAGRRRMTVRVDSIFVRDSLPDVHVVYETRRGPIITQVYPLQGVIRDTGRFATPPAISMRWAGQDPSDEILALYLVNHARNPDDFRSALRHFGVPGQNIVYGDVHGNIGVVTAGRIPLRGSNSPQLPSAGWLPANAWRGYVPPEELPSTFNPESQRLVTANNKIAASTPWHVSTLWESDARARRIIELLDKQASFTAKDFQLMQMDVRSVYAEYFRDAFVEALRNWKNRPLLLTRVMNLLARWDCRMNSTSAEAAIFNSAYVHLLRNIFGDEMDETLFNNYVFLSNLPTRVLPRLLQSADTIWFDDVRTERIERPSHIILRSITDAVTELRTTLGRDMSTWEWGQLHSVEFKHILGRRKPLDKLFNVGPYALGGNNTTINSGEFSFADPYDAVVGPSMRFVVDLASPDSSYIILTTGQSGQPFSRHYADHTILWQTGAMHRLIISPDAVRSSGWKRLLLSP